MPKELLHARGDPLHVNAGLVRFVAPHKGGHHAFVIFGPDQKLIVQGTAREVATYLFVGGFGVPSAPPESAVDIDDE